MYAWIKYYIHIVLHFKRMHTERTNLQSKFEEFLGFAHLE